MNLDPETLYRHPSMDSKRKYNQDDFAIMQHRPHHNIDRNERKRSCNYQSCYLGPKKKQCAVSTMPTVFIPSDNPSSFDGRITNYIFILSSLDLDDKTLNECEKYENIFESEPLAVGFTSAKVWYVGLLTT